jgi:hypothetical protein
VKKDTKRGYRYLFEKTKRFRFKQIVKDERFLNGRKELLRKIRHLDEKDKAFKTFVFSLRWGISWKVNPNKSYEENNKMLKKEMFFPPPVSLELDTPILDCKLSGNFAIDLRYPERAIIRSFEEQLKWFLDTYKKKVEVAESHRTRLDNYETYLRVYRLHEKGYSWDRLANMIYKSEDLNYDKQKVKRDYIRGKRLIEDNFRQIR